MKCISAKDRHPPAKFFNLGEKVVFWCSILTGLAIIVTGLALLFPYQFTFLPGELAVNKMQFASMWHSMAALFLISVVIGHIYIGTIGSQGALSGMTTGYVDRNWAKENHSLWLEELESKSAGDTEKQPAE